MQAGGVNISTLKKSIRSIEPESEYGSERSFD